eukprot:GHVQ01033065.1.p1 GENE.GHVQ01033065.1~~GHVQ01033065.1.p1  ORF type:complete len:209 (+),score=31.23 GHVQ01033065.1:781-1407(+)
MFQVMETLLWFLIATFILLHLLAPHTVHRLARHAPTLTEFLDSHRYVWGMICGGLYLASLYSLLTLWVVAEFLSELEAEAFIKDAQRLQKADSQYLLSSSAASKVDSTSDSLSRRPASPSIPSQRVAVAGLLPRTQSARPGWRKLTGKEKTGSRETSSDEAAQIGEGGRTTGGGDAMREKTEMDNSEDRAERSLTLNIPDEKDEGFRQ